VPNSSSSLRRFPATHDLISTAGLNEPASRPLAVLAGIIIAGPTADLQPHDPRAQHPLEHHLLAFGNGYPRAVTPPLATRTALPSAARSRPARFGSGSAAARNLRRGCCPIAAVRALAQRVYIVAVMRRTIKPRACCFDLIRRVRSQLSTHHRASAGRCRAAIGQGLGTGDWR